MREGCQGSRRKLVRWGCERLRGGKGVEVRRFVGEEHVLRFGRIKLKKM